MSTIDYYYLARVLKKIESQKKFLINMKKLYYLQLVKLTNTIINNKNNLTRFLGLKQKINKGNDQAR